MGHGLSGYDLIGLTGVGLMLVAYGLTVAGRLDVQAWPALAANLIGAVLVLISLGHDFNLSAAVIEGAWAIIALGGLVRLGWRRASGGVPTPASPPRPVK